MRKPQVKIAGREFRRRKILKNAERGERLPPRKKCRQKTVKAAESERQNLKNGQVKAEAISETEGRKETAENKA